jgi:hypothetical protein
MLWFLNIQRIIGQLFGLKWNPCLDCNKDQILDVQVATCCKIMGLDKMGMIGMKIMSLGMDQNAQSWCLFEQPRC